MDGERLRARYYKPAYLEILGSPITRGGRCKTVGDECDVIVYRSSRLLERQYRRITYLIHLHKPPTVSDVMNQSRLLCRDFIYHCLKSKNLLSAKLQLRPSAAQHSDIAIEIRSLATELDRQYPKLYKNICRQLNVVMSSQQVLNSVFVNLADAMFNGTYVSWGRIVALFLIAGTLSVECVQQGHPEFVYEVAEVFVDVTGSHLAEWIVDQGGWCDVKRAFKMPKKTSVLWFVTGLSTFIGFTITMVMMTFI